MRRTHFEYQFAERRDRIALDIELGRQHFLQVAHVRITDMAGVGTGMHRNSLRSETLAVQRRTHHVGKIAAARIAHHGDLIDVHTQFCHKKLYLPKTTGNPSNFTRKSARLPASFAIFARIVNAP